MPVTIKCMERNPGLTIPRYNDVISPVPWYIVISGFQCMRISKDYFTDDCLVLKFTSGSIPGGGGGGYQCAPWPFAYKTVAGESC